MRFQVNPKVNLTWACRRVTRGRTLPSKSETGPSKFYLGRFRIYLKAPGPESIPGWPKSNLLGPVSDLLESARARVNLPSCPPVVSHTRTYVHTHTHTHKHTHAHTHTHLYTQTERSCEAKPGDTLAKQKNSNDHGASMRCCVLLSLNSFFLSLWE